MSPKFLRREMDVLQLPPDVFRMTLDSLSIDEILRLCQLNKEFKRRVCQDQNTWQHLYRSRLSATPPSGTIDWKAPFLALPKTPLARWLHARRMGYERLLTSMRPKKYWIDAAVGQFGPDAARGFTGAWIRGLPSGELGYLNLLLQYEPPDLANWPYPAASEEMVPIGTLARQEKARRDISEIAAELKKEIERRANREEEKKDYVLRGNHGYELGQSEERSVNGRPIITIEEEDGEIRVDFPSRNRYQAFLDILDYLDAHLVDAQEILPAYTARALFAALNNVPHEDEWLDYLLDYILPAFFDERNGPFEIEDWDLESAESENDSDSD